VLERLALALEAAPGAVAAQTRNVFATEPERVHYDGAYFHYLGLLSLRNFYVPLAAAEGAGVVPAHGLIAIAILLDRDVVLSAGGYDEDFFILFEDFDLALRLAIAGYALLSVEEAICLHQGGTPGISFRGGSYPKIRAFYHSRNRWLLIAKNYRWRTVLVALPGILVYEAAWCAFTLGKGHFKAHVAGKTSFLRSLPTVLAKRRGIQRQRRVPDRELLVAGPLTFSPELCSTPARRALARGLDVVLSLWWRLARGLAA
jgi:GT2 family glycosyltransferase